MQEVLPQAGPHFPCAATYSNVLRAVDGKTLRGTQAADCRDWRPAQTCEKGHGRLQWRALVASTKLNELLATRWSGVAQVFCLRRRVAKPLVCTQEFVYGITSLNPAQAGPQRLLELIRDQWAIENRLHRRRDVTLGNEIALEEILLRLQP